MGEEAIQQSSSRTKRDPNKTSDTTHAARADLERGGHAVDIGERQLAQVEARAVRAPVEGLDKDGGHRWKNGRHHGALSTVVLLLHAGDDAAGQRG